MARSHGVLTLAVVFALGQLPVAVRAGEVAGRIIFTPPTIEASLGGGPDIVNGSANKARDAGPVLVYVAEAEGELPRTPTSAVRVRLAGGKLTPSFVAVSLGSVITFENADGREHRMRSRSGPLVFDLGRQPRGASHELRAEQTGSIKVECALHKDMRGEIIILPHAAFAIADAAGSYRLRDLPPGRATIVAYAPKLGEVSREIVVPEATAVEVGFTF